MQVIELPEAVKQPSAPADKAPAAVKVDGKPVAVARVEVVRVPAGQIGQQTTAQVQPADSPSAAATETDTTAASTSGCLWQASAPRAPPDVEDLVLDLDAAYSDSSTGSPDQADQSQELTYVDIDTFLATF